MKDPDNLGMNEIFVAEVIISTKTRRGKGTQESPIRIVTEIFIKNGLKLAEYDPDAYVKED